MAVWLSACSSQAVSPQAIHMNDIQTIASHNSYKKAMSQERFQALKAIDPATARSLEYEHLPLEAQLDLGVRMLEIDLFYDPQGDRYGPSQPGFRVMHVQNLDDNSHCTTFEKCLNQLRQWSQEHPQHLPIAVSINAKEEVIDYPGFTVPLVFNEAAWVTMDASLEGILGDRLIRPKQVVRDGGPDWPVLDEARGKFLFVLDSSGEQLNGYAEKWQGRAMFASLPPSSPGAAFLIMNDPVADFEQIQALVREGYLVRTRADAGTEEARINDVSRRDRAFASGAHYICTDYYVPTDKFGNDYVVEMPEGGVARCNTVRLDRTCVIE